jgi:hypothetical protein
MSEQLRELREVLDDMFARCLDKGMVPPFLVVSVATNGSRTPCGAMGMGSCLKYSPATAKALTSFSC